MVFERVRRCKESYPEHRTSVVIRLGEVWLFASHLNWALSLAQAHDIKRMQKRRVKAHPQHVIGLRNLNGI